ncbi:hypothetical protein PMAYCL1PPCAC_26654, partial [Pristionchus mayeri]
NTREMGCRQNSELVNELVAENHISTQKVERVLRLVDRGIFIQPHNKHLAYADAPFRTNNLHPGQVHISAPSIYCSVLEMLDLHKGQSFLNIGSGSGYLSALVGLLIGENGTSHGVELHSNIIDHARNALRLFESQKFIAGYDWCRPQFAHGNAFLLSGISKRYERIYVGAQVVENDLNLFSEMLMEGGIMIVPVRIGRETKFQRVKRTSDGYEIKDFMHVTFAELIQPNGEDRSEHHSSSRKRKIIEDPTNPNDHVTVDLIALFNPRSLEVLSSYVIRKKIADPLRVSLPIAVVQKVKNTLTHFDVLENTIRLHDRAAARRAAGNAVFIRGNEARIPMMPIPIIDRNPDRAFVDRDEDEDDMLRPFAERINGDMIMDVQRMEERMEAVFNNEMRAAAAAGGDRPFEEEDVEHILFDPQMMNIIRQDAEARMRFDQFIRENDEDDDTDDDNDDDDDDEEGGHEDEEEEVDFNGTDAHVMPVLLPARLRAAAEEESVVRVDEREREGGVENMQAGRIRPVNEFIMEDEDVIGFQPFRLRIRRSGEEQSDDSAPADEIRGANCARCHRRVCKCRAPTLKVAANRVINGIGDSRITRMAKSQPWVRRITRLTGPYHRPRSFAEQIPGIFDCDFGPPPKNGRLSIEDWYLQKKKEEFISKLADLEDAVRETGRQQFEQEINDFQDLSTLAENKKLSKVTFENEQDSISRFEKEIVGLLNQLPLPDNVRRTLKWNLFRNS